MRRRAMISALVLMTLTGLAGGAHAACIGGKDIKGSFGVTVNGPVAGSNNTAQVYNGILQADGKCGLKGTLTGGVFGQPGFINQSVTGSYSVPANKQGTVTIQLPDSSTAVVFDIGLVKDGKSNEVTGIASNGSYITTIDFVAIKKAKYTLSSLSGTYIATCTGASNGGKGGLGNEIDYFTFDGAGNLSVAPISDDNGVLYTDSLTGTYTVTKTGAFEVQYPDPYSNFFVYGEFVGDGGELHAVYNDTRTGYGPYRSCIIKQQS
jgi:hypothetical protein